MNEKAMEAASFLRDIARIRGSVERCADILDEHRSMLYGLKSPVLDDIGGSRSTADPDRLGSAIDKLVKLEQELNEHIDSLVDREREAFSVIKQMPSIKYQEIILARFFQMKTVETLAEELEQDERSVYRLSGKALEMFYNVWKNITE